MAEQPISELFLNNVDVLPLWVKQVLYLKTREKLRAELADFLDILVSDNLMQYYIPSLTFSGKNELATHERRLPEEFYTFFKGAQKRYSLFEITLSNYWTFAQTCTIFVRAIELQLINIPEDDIILSIAQFIAGKLRTGEMMRKLHKVDIMQLEKALRLQKMREMEGTPVKMAELMIELGYITERDVAILLAFKDDAKKRFVMGIGFSFVKPTTEEDTQTLVKGMQKEIKRLDEENRLLKNRLRKILNLKS